MKNWATGVNSLGFKVTSKPVCYKTRLQSDAQSFSRLSHAAEKWSICLYTDRYVHLKAYTKLLVLCLAIRDGRVKLMQLVLYLDSKLNNAI